ncbi:hypothetical protein EYS14_13565 [Alteromonadaceae bacterium M269]|nr:hypothetical protein EYS14_13565 [Alteromonadaceae bacterium M269]
MEDISRNKNTYIFGEYQLSSLTEQLSRSDEHIKLEPQLFNLLLLLVSHAGEIVDRQQIQDDVWAGRPVSDEAIRVAIKKLRDVFDDDAKAPTYIKTIPRKGYRWLAIVSIKNDTGDNNEAATPILSQKMLLPALGISALSVILLIFWSSIFPNAQNSNSSSENQAKVNVETLTSLPGSEIYADYHSATNKLAFLHRDTRNSPQQLYVKDLNSGLIQRLSWDKANYSDANWSQDGKRLAFNRLIDNRQSTHIAEFDPLGNVSQLVTLDNPNLTDKFILDWTYDQTGLLLGEARTPGKQHSIYQYLISSDRLSTVSTPNVTGHGDYFAKQSNDGLRIAILRDVGDQQVSLLVFEMATGNMLVNKVLPFRASKLAWQDNDKAIILSSFYGQSIRYIISTDFFGKYPTLPPNTLDIFNSCGERCYVLRQHNGNYLDIQETPLSALFKDDNNNENSLILDSGRLLKFSGAQDFPRYLMNYKPHADLTEQQLVYASQTNNTLLFKKFGEDNQVSTFGKLDVTDQLSALDVSPNTQKIAGVSGGRLFVIRTDASETKPRFLTSALERVTNPVWHADSRSVYLTSTAENTPSIILFNTLTRERETVITGFAAFRPCFGAPESAIGVDTQGMAWTLANVDGKWVKQRQLITIASDNPNRWQIISDTLYFSKIQGRESQLCRYSLDPESEQQEPECASTGQNRFRLNFDVHPSQKKVLLVESLSAQSDIIKMNW